MRRGLHGTQRLCVTVWDWGGGAVVWGGHNEEVHAGSRRGRGHDRPRPPGPTGHAPLGPAPNGCHHPIGHAHIATPPVAIFGCWHRAAIFMPGTRVDGAVGVERFSRGSLPEMRAGMRMRLRIRAASLSPPFLRRSSGAVTVPCPQQKWRQERCEAEGVASLHPAGRAARSDDAQRARRAERRSRVGRGRVGSGRLGAREGGRDPRGDEIRPEALRREPLDLIAVKN